MLQQVLRHLEVSTSGEGFTDLTAALNRAIGGSGLETGLAVINVLHTSCSLTINENADPCVLADLTAYLRALVPQEGTALTCTSLSLSFQQRQLVLGTWQAVYLWEHRARSHCRRIGLHLLGAPVGAA